MSKMTLEDSPALNLTNTVPDKVAEEETNTDNLEPSDTLEPSDSIVTDITDASENSLKSLLHNERDLTGLISKTNGAPYNVQSESNTSKNGPTNGGIVGLEKSMIRQFNDRRTNLEVKEDVAHPLDDTDYAVRQRRSSYRKMRSLSSEAEKDKCKEKEIKDEDTDNEDTEHHGEVDVVKEIDDDYQRPAKLDLIIGFLRLLNFMSACGAIFGIVLSMYIQFSVPEEDLWLQKDQLTDEQRQALGLDKDWKQIPENYFWISYVKTFAGMIQLVYLVITAVLVTVDSVATFTFRWKEYGELTFRHTDASSILFHLSRSRWKMRFLSALTLTSSLSLNAANIIFYFYGRSLEERKYRRTGIPSEQIPEIGFHAVIWYISILSGCILSLVLGYILHLIPNRFHKVAWLDDRLKMSHIDDKEDTWLTRKELALSRIYCARVLIESTVPKHYQDTQEDEEYYERKYKNLTPVGKVIEYVNKIIYFTCYMCSVAIILQCFLFIDLDITAFRFWTVVISGSASIIIAIYLAILVVVQALRLPGRSTPALSRIFIPFLLSSGVRQLLDLTKDFEEVVLFVAVYASLLSLFLVFQLFALLTRRCSYEENVSYFFFRFLYQNFFKREGAYKKMVRMFDTLGSSLALAGLVIGLCSVFIDQYDLNFKLMGDLKAMMEGLKKFQEGIRDVETTLKQVISKFDFEVTCEHIYTSIASGAVAGVFLSLVPGASSAAAIGSKTANYTIRVGSALSKLARFMKAAVKKMWLVQKIVRRVSVFTFGAFKKLSVGGASVTLIKLLPFFPPVVIGIYVLFSAFWPQRILFFSAKQRRKFINGQFLTWLLALVLLILALTINTALVDELTRVFDDALPLVKVILEKKLGWKLSVIASGLAMAASVSFIIAFLILKFKTDKNHDNLTNMETEWKQELEKRQLVSFSTPFGQKIEKRNQIRYKKERIGPWTWVLPITLCMIACGFGVLANLYPKIDMYREPKGTLGNTLEKLIQKVNVFDDERVRIRDYGERECMPWASLDNVFSETLQQKSNLLMNPINTFFNRTEQLFHPLRQVLARTRKQIIADVGDDLFGQDVLNTIETFRLLDLRYFGMLLLIPRLINLAILIFGMFTMSVATCRMIICECVEPRLIVNAFGTVVTFSVMFVLGAQIALFNILSDVGIPFYRITVRYGLGFIYDLVCDAIMISIYIGMKNEFFFAIPKRKVTITYSVPGVSDEGPNIRGQII